MAKYLDSNGLLYFWGKLKSSFVAKEVGKGLSSNDLTDTLKANYDAAYAYSQSPLQVDQTVTAGDSDAVSSVAVINYAVAKNSSITGASKCKITYDSKGLVTGGADLVAGDIPNLAATYVAVSTKGQAGGVASLDADGLVPSSQLPSYVDDVIELLSLCAGQASAPASPANGDYYFNTTDSKLYKYASGSWTAQTASGSKFYNTTNAKIYTYSGNWGSGAAPEASKIFVALDTNISYRWGGSLMVQITPGDMTAITNAEIDTVCAA